MENAVPPVVRRHLETSAGKPSLYARTCGTKKENPLIVTSETRTLKR
jgi:hypothetical protein